MLRWRRVAGMAATLVVGVCAVMAGEAPKKTVVVPEVSALVSRPKASDPKAGAEAAEALTAPAAASHNFGTAEPVPADLQAAVPAVVAALKDAGGQVRPRAVDALSRMGGARAVTPLAAVEDIPTRLPDTVAPQIGCWFWTDDDLKPDGWRPFLDMAAAHTSWTLLSTSIRIPRAEVTDADLHDRIKAAAEYARARGMGVVMDLDVRLARAAFQKLYPDELQEMLRLREVELRDAGSVALAIASDTPSDHYTFRATPYVPLAGRLVRVYAYVRGPQGIDSATVRDITAECDLREAGPKQVVVSIPCSKKTAGRRACVMAAFAHFTPDVFAPHLLAFQREVIHAYKDVLLVGVCKDEWGFPPCYDGCPAKNDFWFSRPMAEAYAKRPGRGDLLRDALLMWAGERGRVAERQAAINHYMELCRERNAAIEDDFYKATKETFGPKAVVATHPTWWPFPDTREFKKNGLDWWQVTRDLAQTDEVTPFCVRTALAKKWASPTWYNMYYATGVAAYEKGLWTHALGGGRINYHPLYPHPKPLLECTAELLRGRLMRGESRVRLLNFVSRAPLDCPVAVIFGHPSAMNWAGPAYSDVGMALSDALWCAGYPADLIPSSEIRTKALKVAEDGSVQYGAQRYAAVVLYHPEFEGAETAAFFKAAAAGKTALFRVGNWTADFDGQPYDGIAALPPQVTACTDAGACAAQIVAKLREGGVAPQAAAVPWNEFGLQSAAPPVKGQCRLVDGTQILIAGEKDPAGDPIQTILEVRGHKVVVEAVGLVAVRLRADGTLDALAAGGLKRLQVGPLTVELETPADVALWHDAQGKTCGVLQDYAGEVPAALAALASEWRRLAVPPPLAPAK